MRAALPCFALSTLLAISAAAQNRIMPIGKNTNVPITEDCKTLIRLVAELVTKYPHPNDWTWYVACNDKDWAAVERHIGLAGLSNKDVIYGATSIKISTTYIRGAALIK